MTSFKNTQIPFNWPYLTGKELYYIAEAQFNGRLSGDGLFTKKCHQWLEQNTPTKKALLTHSCTAALEMSAMLIDIQPGDEVIMPSYTFVSTANAFVLFGGVPVFVDIRPDTLNIDETKIEEAITDKTRAIVPVHYAGVACEMDAILEVAKRYDLVVIEDAAQGVMSKYKNKALGTLGTFGAYSFHETKNVISGEGGALLVNDSELAIRAEIIREKGTNRSQFFRGQVDKYTWVDKGSSYLPSEIISAFLWAQLEEAYSITESRLTIWERYQDAFELLEKQGKLQRPYVPPHCTHNAHMYYLILRDANQRQAFIEHMNGEGINCVFHYVPLHSSPHGVQVARSCGDLKFTNEMAERIVRLPFWIGLGAEQNRVIGLASSWLANN